MSRTAPPMATLGCSRMIVTLLLRPCSVSARVILCAPALERTRNATMTPATVTKTMPDHRVPIEPSGVIAAATKYPLMTPRPIALKNQYHPTALPITASGVSMVTQTRNP